MHESVMSHEQYRDERINRYNKLTATRLKKPYSIKHASPKIERCMQHGVGVHPMLQHHGQALECIVTYGIKAASLDKAYSDHMICLRRSRISPFS